MGDRRKLKAEIDRTLKKIEEGVEVFDRIFNKVQDAETQNNKEKYEVRASAFSGSQLVCGRESVVLLEEKKKWVTVVGGR